MKQSEFIKMLITAHDVPNLPRSREPSDRWLFLFCPRYTTIVLQNEQKSV